MRLKIFYNIDALENSAKFTGKRLYQTLLSPAHMFSWEFFDLGTSFLQNTIGTTASDFSSIFLKILFQNRYLFNNASYIRIYQNSCPPASFVPILFYIESILLW